MNSDSQKQRGFSLVEMAVGIVVLGILGTAFVSAFSSVVKGSASPLQTVIMENIAASRMDNLMSGTFQSALDASGTTVAFNVDDTIYSALVTGQSSVVSGVTVVTVASGVHLTVLVSTKDCRSCVSLSGDTFDVQ